MNNRSFLKEQSIVSAMLVSQNAELLDITIPNMMKYSDWALIVMDNETREVEEKVYEYQRKYGNIFARRSSVPNKLFTRGGVEMTYRQRSKAVKGIFRDDVFFNLRRILDLKQGGRENIDILLWPDSDEIWTDHLPELLERFWRSSKKAVLTKPIDVVGDMRTVKADSMGSHVHILKYHNGYSAYPWRQFALYHPLQGRRDTMKAKYYSVHLAYLTKGIRDWRKDNWKTDKSMECDLWKIDKDIITMSPREIINIFNRDADIKYGT